MPLQVLSANIKMQTRFAALLPLPPSPIGVGPSTITHTVSGQLNLSLFVTSVLLNCWPSFRDECVRYSCGQIFGSGMGENHFRKLFHFWNVEAVSILHSSSASTSVRRCPVDSRTSVCSSPHDEIAVSTLKVVHLPPEPHFCCYKASWTDVRNVSVVPDLMRKRTEILKRRVNCLHISRSCCEYRNTPF